MADGPAGVWRAASRRLIAVGQGATLQASQIINKAGTIGATGLLAGPVQVLGGTVQVGASPDPLHIEGAYDQTGGTTIG